MRKNFPAAVPPHSRVSVLGAFVLFVVAAALVISSGCSGKSPSSPSTSRAAIPPYNRADWRHWVDADEDCQDTRQEVLIRDSLVPVAFKPRADNRQCDVLAGYWIDPYSNEVFADPTKLDIDHLVPLKNAHFSGGWAWDSAKRRDYANYLEDPFHLLPVKASLNRSKADQGPEAWKPPNQDYWCTYAFAWETIKQRWILTITIQEALAVKEMKMRCQ